MNMNTSALNTIDNTPTPYMGDYLVQMIGDDCIVWTELDYIVLDIGE